MELNPKIKDALLKIDFIKKYEILSQRFNGERIPPDERLRYIDGEEVMAIITNSGYSSLFNDREKFFKVDEQIDALKFSVHIILRDGMVDLVWVVKENDELLLGAPWSVYSRRLVGVNYRIKKPVFRTYEDLDDILKYTFDMYEDFKRVLTRP